MVGAPTQMRMHVLFHDNCFDGAASAAVFSRFYRERIRTDVTFSYQGLSHQAGGTPVPESAFQGDENAIVDFRYSQSPRLTWWFDHHASAFQTPGDEAHFLADSSGRKRSAAFGIRSTSLATATSMMTLAVMFGRNA